MPHRKLLRIDTNLLVLLIAGLVHPDIIGRHKRLRKYFMMDFELLNIEIGDHRLIILPNVATESHNVLGLHGEPERGKLLQMLGRVLIESIDNYVPNRIAVRSATYSTIGLADSALFETHAPALLTDDRGLYEAAIRDGQQATFFTYRRIAEGIIKVP